MKTKVIRYLTRLALGTSLVAATLLVAPSRAWSQVGRAGDAPGSGERGSSDADRSDTRSATDEAGSDSQSEREAARSPRGTGRDSTRGADRENADERRDASDVEPRTQPRRANGRESDREMRSGRDRPRDTRRDASGAARKSTGATNRDSRDSTGRSFRLEEIRAPDIGLWFSRTARDGLLISDVASTGAIARFGFLEGDRIVSVNGQRVNAEGDFLRVLLADDVRESRVPVVVLRGGRRQIVYVEPIVFVNELNASVFDPLDQFGIVLDDRYSDRLVVWQVLPRTPAYYAGLRAGDVITTFAGRRVSDPGDFVRLLQVTDPGDIVIQVSRNQNVRDLTVDLSNFGPVVQERTTLRPSIDEGSTDVRVRDDIRSVQPTTDRRLSPRPDVPPGTKVPGGEAGRDRGPIAPSGAEGGTPTTPMKLGFPR